MGSPVPAVIHAMAADGLVELKTGTAKARDKTKRFINTFYELLANMVQRAPGRPFFDAESEEDSHASDHVSIIDC